MPLQGRPKPTQFLSISLALHLININYIQNYECQEKKMNPSDKMSQLHQGKATLARVGDEEFPVSELQLSLKKTFPEVPAT